jgi:uncharacterized protein (TIGR02118 family)
VVVKVVFGWRDHPAKSAQECEDHYRSVHMKLAETAYDGVDGFVALAYDRVRRYLVNDHNQPTPSEREPDMDAFCELYFQDEATMAEAFKRPQMQALFDDHVNFMDVDSAANIRIYHVDETVFLGRRPS